MERLFFLTALCLLLLTGLYAQQIDTISIHPTKYRFEYQGKSIKTIPPIKRITLADPVAPAVRREWSKYGAGHTIGLGLELFGLGVSAVGLARQLQGESNTLILPGSILLLGGVLVDRFIAAPRVKAAARRYNDAKIGRDLGANAPSFEELSAGERAARQRPTAYAPSYVGLALGPGWSKQQVNYEDDLDEPFQSARVVSFGLQYGQAFTDQVGWQVELGLTEHGFRIEQTSSTAGVRVVAKADARLRYLELPFCLSYRLPIGWDKLEVSLLPGLNVGYAVSGKIVARGAGENDTRKVHTRIVDELSLAEIDFADRLDAALLLGARVAIPFHAGALFGEARYHFGLLNLERNSGFDGSKAFNRTALLRLGYRVAL